jgi:hypothetical protein
MSGPEVRRPSADERRLDILFTVLCCSVDRGSQTTCGLMKQQIDPEQRHP